MQPFITFTVLGSMRRNISVASTARTLGIGFHQASQEARTWSVAISPHEDCDHPARRDPRVPARTRV